MELTISTVAKLIADYVGRSRGAGRTIHELVAFCTGLADLAIKVNANPVTIDWLESLIALNDCAAIYRSAKASI